MNFSRFSHILPALAILTASALASAAQAGSLTYQPQNPAFGGSPLNGSLL
jgi:curli production assembly/transport component CsgF